MSKIKNQDYLHILIGGEGWKTAAVYGTIGVIGAVAASVLPIAMNPAVVGLLAVGSVAATAIGGFAGLVMIGGIRYTLAENPENINFLKEKIKKLFRFLSKKNKIMGKSVQSAFKKAQDTQNKTPKNTQDIKAPKDNPKP